MLYSSSSGSLQRIRYCLPVLLLPLMAWVSSCTFKKDYKIDARLGADQKKVDRVSGSETVGFHGLRLSDLGVQEYDTVPANAPAFTTRRIELREVMLEELRADNSEPPDMNAIKTDNDTARVEFYNIIATIANSFVTEDGTNMIVRKLVLVREDK